MSATPGPWRTGTKVHRTIYGQIDGREQLIGVMDRAEDAALAAAAPAMRDLLVRTCREFSRADIPADATSSASFARLHGEAVSILAQAKGGA